jgi:hypothetical protein
MIVELGIEIEQVLHMGHEVGVLLGRDTPLLASATASSARDQSWATEKAVFSAPDW